MSVEPRLPEPSDNPEEPQRHGRRRRGRTLAGVIALVMLAGSTAGFAVARTVGSDGDGDAVVTGAGPASATASASGDRGDGGQPEGEPAELPEPEGPPPDDEEAARQAVVDAFTAVYSTVPGDEAYEETLTRHLDTPNEILDAIDSAGDEFGGSGFVDLGLTVDIAIDEVRFVDATTAAVRYDLEQSSAWPDSRGTEVRTRTSYLGRIGEAVFGDCRWRVTQDTYCSDGELTGVVYCDFLHQEEGSFDEFEPLDAFPPELLEPDGPPPDDEEAARQAIIETWTKVVDETNEDNAQEIINTYVDDPHGVWEASVAGAENFPEEFETATVDVKEITFLNSTMAIVDYDINFGEGVGVGSLPGRVGRAVLIDGQWKVTRGSICADIAMSGTSCLG